MNLCIFLCSDPVFPVLSCVSYPCNIALLFKLLISPTLAMSLNSIYKTLIHVCIQHVRILTLTIVLIVYSTSGHSQTSLHNFCNLLTLFHASGNLGPILLPNTSRIDQI